MNNMKRDFEIGDWVYVKSMAHDSRNLLAVSSGRGMEYTAAGSTLSCYYPLGVNSPVSVVVNATALDPAMTEVALRLQAKMEPFMRGLESDELALLNGLFT